MTRFYGDGYGEMDRYRNWSAPPPFHCYDERSNPIGFPYVDGRPSQTAQHPRPDRLLPEGPEQEQPSAVATRRRIAVACSRCRKRKIKCSGDTGSGLGCQNCRTAGVSSCNFTRVGSLEIGLNQPSGALSASFIRTGNNERLQMMNAQPYHHFSQPPPRLIPVNLPVASYYGAAAQYDMDGHADNYMLSPATPLTPSEPYASCTPSDNGRSWASYSNRALASSPYARYSGYETVPYTTEFQSRQRLAMPSADITNNVFSTHGLHVALPAPPPISNPVPGGRELPLPAVGARPQLQAQACEPSQNRMPSYPRSIQYWQDEQNAIGTRQDSISSSRSSEVVAPIPQKPSPVVMAISEHSSFQPSAASPGVSPTIATAPLQHSVTDGNSQHQHGLGNDHRLYGMPHASLSDTRLSPETAPISNTYTFSIAPRRGEQVPHGKPSGGDDGPCSSSSDYVPLSYPAEPPTSHRYSLNPSRYGSTENRHGLLQRSSMPSIGHEC